MAQPHRLSLQSIVKADNLDSFNDEFESLLESHDKHRRSRQFIRERLSVISPTSNQKASAIAITKFQKKKQQKFNKHKHPQQQYQQQPPVDELEDIKSKLEILQNILKYLPDDAVTYTQFDAQSSKPNLQEPLQPDSHFDDMDAEPSCSGFLVVVGANISEATRFYTELINNVLYLRREPNSKIKQAITISFIQSTALEQDAEEESKDTGNAPSTKDNLLQKKREKVDNGKYVDLFLAHLESRSANFSFKLFSPTGIYVVSASCYRDKLRFSKCIEASLLRLFDNETWCAKMEASQQLLPIEKSQFEIQIDRHEQIMNSLTLTGLAHNVGLLGSTNKEKSGVMRILKHTHSHSYKHFQHNHKHNKWEDHFFVLAHCTLYYFQHDPDSQITRSSMPKSFIPLKYATIDLDVERIKSDRFVFFISTPLRTVYLRCRHPVALAEWVTALYAAQGNKEKTASHKILDRIRSIRSKVSTLHNLLKEKKGIKIFESYLKSIGSQPVLRCWLAILHWKSGVTAFRNDNSKQQAAKQAQQQQQTESKHEEEEEEEEKEAAGDGDIGSVSEAQKQAQLIFEQYIDDEKKKKKTNIWKALDSDDYDEELVADCKKNVYLDEQPAAGDNDNDNEVDVVTKIMESFDEILEILDDKLQFEFSANFVKSAEYLALQKKYDSKDKYLPLPLNREIADFPPSSFVVLVVTNTDLSSKEIKLSTKKSVATIGRDCSNIIVLDDAHVSRSHARINYDAQQAHFTDLGSHHGSYLNGNRVLHERLTDGDRLKLGGCDVLFRVKQKTNLMNKMFGKMFSGNNNNNHNDHSNDDNDEHSNQQNDAANNTNNANAAAAKRISNVAFL